MQISMNFNGANTIDELDSKREFSKKMKL